MPAASPNVFTAEPESADHLAPNSSAITLYAELLLNIRTVTLFASLRTAHSGETRAVLSSDCQTITVSHEGESATIRLPIKAKGGGNASLMLPADPRSKVLTLRLQIEELNGSELFSGGQAEGRKANLVPWDGASLNKMKGVKVLCKSCQTPVLADGKVSEWRDLPNENWAEMMDFWHCHKPDEHHLHDHSQSETISKKGYSAATRLEAAPGLGFVHLTSLLFKEQDCDGVQVGSFYIVPKCCSTGCKEGSLSPSPWTASSIQAPEKNGLLTLHSAAQSSSARSTGSQRCERRARSFHCLSPRPLGLAG